MINKLWTLTIPLILLTSCARNDLQILKIAASPVPHAEILEFLKKDLKEEGIELEIIVFDDYNTPNLALANGEIDANFFQHLPFLEEQIRQFNYPLVVLAKVEIEPMGLYSKKIGNLSQLREGAVIAVPNDPTNEARALHLLQRQGIITLDDSLNTHATVLNILNHPRKFQFIEVDAAMITRALDDVDIAVINTNYALQAGLSPQKDALVLEDENSPYINVIAIKEEDQNQAKLQLLKRDLQSDKMRSWIKEKYKGAVLPAF